MTLEQEVEFLRKGIRAYRKALYVNTKKEMLCQAYQIQDSIYIHAAKETCDALLWEVEAFDKGVMQDSTGADLPRVQAGNSQEF